VFGFEGAADLVHLGVLAAYALLTWRIAVRWMERRLIV
jgi:lipooligosaccharide transport system permease protein